MHIGAHMHARTHTHARTHARTHTHTRTRVETGSGHPGHILSGSSGSDPLYKLSGSDPDSTLNHVH